MFTSCAISCEGTIAAVGVGFDTGGCVGTTAATGAEACAAAGAGEIGAAVGGVLVLTTAGSDDEPQAETTMVTANAVTVKQKVLSIRESRCSLL